MNRRDFIGSLAAASLSAAPLPAIDATAMQEHLTALSLHGRPPGGTFQSGVSRIGYSDADIAGRKFITGLLEAAGAQVKIDPAGNIFAHRPGLDPSLPPVLFGSHIDSVPNGGNFDGDLGSIASVQILRLLQENRLPTRRPLTAVVWACEEATFAGASLNGSRAAAGQMLPGELNHVSNGLVKAEAIRRIGGDPSRIESARIQPGAYHAYLELHIEQGGTLARDAVPIGVVDGIVAIDRYEAIVTGLANHAGTTPMADRQDALLAAAELALSVRESVTSEPGQQVGTVGHMEVTPNSANVIPGEVRMTIELRDLSSAKLERLMEKIRTRSSAIAAESKTTIQLTKRAHNESATAAPEIQRVIEAAASKLRLNTRHLPSGAGHDAQMMATLMPMGMIFVPSARGISHSPKELTSWQDCANGANVLLEAVRTLAR
ncbi:MAG: Zn-dependent hydrolase [Acidobacteria bacterium]|nr:Zn-dependent hydrolase [Acidobacteriota bacterium]